MVGANEFATTKQGDDGKKIVELSNTDDASTSRQQEDDVVVEIENGVSHDSSSRRLHGFGRDDDGSRVTIMPINLIPKTSIPKFSVEFGEGDIKFYHPRIISIGPYHRGKTKLEPTESLKWKCVESILTRNPRCSVQDYINELAALTTKAALCYEEDLSPFRTSLDPSITYNVFVEMMLTDGCFIVEYLLHVRSRTLSQMLDTKIWMHDVVRNDLLLLENQLPFFVVERIFCLVTGEGPEQLMILVHDFFQRVSPINTNSLAHYKPPPHHLLIHHLLHLYHWFLFSSLEGDNPGTSSSDPSRQSHKLKRTIPSATDLEEAGIKFRVKMEATASVMDVTFENGAMEITPLFIDTLTVSQIRNLISFEKFDPYMEPHATTFAQFMDHIINTSKDVALLRKSGIIEHALGSNEEVAAIFNNLTSGTLEYQTPKLTMMYKDVDEYCKTKRHKWRAILMRDYFGSPWAAISLVAAVILLSLTFLQTFFSMYSYFRPPSAK